MLMKIFTIYDCKAEAHLPPFYCPAAGTAIRSFGEAADDPSHAFCKHAADYTLFQIGVFDDSNASIEMYEAKISLGTALEHQAVKEKPQLRGIQGGE